MMTMDVLMGSMINNAPILYKITPGVRMEFFRCFILLISYLGQLTPFMLSIDVKRAVTRIFVSLLKQANQDNSQFGLERFGPAILAETANGIIDNFSGNRKFSLVQIHRHFSLLEECFNTIANEEDLVNTALMAGALAKNSMNSVRDSCLAQSRKSGMPNVFDYYCSNLTDLLGWH